MDLGGFASSEPSTPPPPRAVAGSPAALQTQQQAAVRPAPQPAPGTTASLPPAAAGQAAFAPAPTPGFGSQPTPGAGRKLGEQELKSLLAGKTLTVADGRQLVFGPSGSYQESRNGQVVAAGHYQIRDVSVCVQFTSGLSRCDSFVQQGDRLYVEDRNGQRLPVSRG